MCAGVAGAQEPEHRSLEVKIGFEVAKTEIRSAYGNNASQLKNLCEFLDELDPADIGRLNISGYTSPEGRYEQNKQLARGRAESLIHYIIEHSTLTTDHLRVGDTGLAWHSLRPLVEQSQIVGRDRALQLIDQALAHTDDASQLKVLDELKALENGRTWRTMSQTMFAKVRTCDFLIVVLTKREVEPEVVEPPVVEEPESVVEEPVVEEPIAIPEPEPEVEPQPTPAPEVLQTETLENLNKRHWYLKTNGIGWLMLVSNIAAEIEGSDHWSFTLPIYFSTLNYFTHKVKFRTLTFQHEARYWFGPYTEEGGRVFVGAHLGLGWWNYALGGDYRYQDRDANTPSFGGGLSTGYRIHLRDRWRMEFTLGIGVYTAHYDKFVNDYNGARVAYDLSKTFVGIDQAAVSLIYTFDLKGGQK